MTDWPFKNTKNTLDVEMENTMINTETECPKDPSSNSTETEGNLQWLKISLNGVATYLNNISLKLYKYNFF